MAVKLTLYIDKSLVGYAKEHKLSVSCIIHPHSDTHFKSIRTPVSESFGHPFGLYPDTFGILTES
jgi:hypothetical protein